MEQVDPGRWDSLGAAYQALAEAPLTVDTVEEWLQRWSDLAAALWEAAGNAASALHENTADEEAEARHMHFVQEIMPRAQVAEQVLKDRLLDLEGFEPAAGLQTTMARFRADRRVFTEANVPIRTDLDVLGARYRKLTGQMTVEWEGETLTLDQAETVLQRADRAERERAWRQIHQRWLQERESINEIFLEMLYLRRQVASNAGFDNYREVAWLERRRFDYSPEDALRFHDAIEAEVVPVARRIYERRREDLGLDRLRPWDLDVDPLGRPPLRPFADVAELEEGCGRIFHAVDPVLGRQFDLLRDGYLELPSRPNKAPGGYCRTLHVSKRNYIFMNAVGTHDNVQTLLHEGGHAFHGQHAFALPLIWQRVAPTEMAEVASMGMEMLALPYFEKEKGGFYDPEEAGRARREHLEGVITFLPYMAVVDAFQHWVYTEASRTTTAADLDEQWGRLWERFMVGIDYGEMDEVRDTGWHRKRHIFVYPFYYIEYGLAQVGALQLWRRARREPVAALADYRKALALGGTRPLPELFEAAGVRLAFDRETLADLMAAAGDVLEQMA